MDVAEQVRSFRDLRVWQAAMVLVDDVYQSTRSFPRSEDYALASQMRRAVVSVPSNIAEGHTREHLREYLYHISVSQELETQVEIADRQGYIDQDHSHRLLERISSVGKQLYALRNALIGRMSSGPRHPAPDTRNRGPN